MQPRTSHRLGLLALGAALLLASLLAVVTAVRRQKNPNRNVIPYGRVELAPLSEEKVRELCQSTVGGELAPPGALRIELAQPGPGRLTGSVVYNGEERPASEIGCGRRALVPGEPAEGVVVWAADISGFDALTGTIRLELSDCGMDPPIRALLASRKIEVANGREVPQTVTAVTRDGEERVRAEVATGGRSAFPVEQPGLHRIDANGAQAGWLLTLEHPVSGVSDRSGQLLVNSAPPGIYTLCYWHEQVGVGGGTVDVQ